MAFGPDGALYVADEGQRAIVRVSPEGDQENFITHWEGQQINGANDLVFDEHGNLYFTDPWTSSPRNPVAGVYGYEVEDRNAASDRHGDAVHQRHRHQRGPPAGCGDLSAHGLGVPPQRRRERGRPSAVLPAPDVPDAPALPPNVQEALGVKSVCGPDGMALDAYGRLYVTHYSARASSSTTCRGTLRPTDARDDPDERLLWRPEHDQLFVTVDDIGELVVYDSASRRRAAVLPVRTTDHPWRRDVAELGDCRLGVFGDEAAGPLDGRDLQIAEVAGEEDDPVDQAGPAAVPARGRTRCRWR